MLFMGQSIPWRHPSREDIGSRTFCQGCAGEPVWTLCRRRPPGMERPAGDQA
jgi:hypothetical protein